MAWFGSQSSPLEWEDINDIMMTHRAAMGAVDGVADSMSAYVRMTIGSGKAKIKMALYDTSANLIGETDEIEPTVGTAAWVTATFSAPKPSLTAGVLYQLVVITDNILVQIGVTGRQLKPPYWNRHDHIAYEDAFEDPATWADSNASLSIYCTYTETPHVVPILGKGTMWTP